MVANFIAILLGLVLVNNFVLGRFPQLFTVPPADAPAPLHARLGLATIVVLALAGAPSWLTVNRLLPGLGVPELGVLCWILLVAGAGRLTWLSLRWCTASWRDALEEFRPLVVFNSAAVGLSVSIGGQGPSPLAAILQLAGAGALFWILMAVFAGVRQRLTLGEVPALVQGAAIALVTAAIMSLALSGLEGIWRQ